jgi:integrase
MAYFRRLKTGWRAQVEKAGIRRSRVFDLKADAVAWATKLEAEIEGQAHTGLASDTLTFHALLDRFQRDECPKRKGQDTEVKRLEYLKRQIADVPLREVNATLIAKWRDQRMASVKPATVRREMALLRTILDVARREWRLFAVNPMADVRKPPAPSPRTRLITQEEIDAVVKALNYREDMPVVQAKQQVAVMFLIAIETGMRAGEIGRAVIKGRVAHLATSKNSDAREVPLSKRALELYAKLPEGFDLADGTRDGSFRTAREKAGLSGFTFHDSRAVALTRLSKKLNVMELARMIGHRDPRSLMIYYRQAAEDIAAKLD